MKKTALYPGSFDPVTKGHIDIIRRSAALFDRLIIGIFKNSSKNRAWFSDEEKCQMIQEILEKENIKAEIKVFNGLLVDFIKEEIDPILEKYKNKIDNKREELRV